MQKYSVKVKATTKQLTKQQYIGAVFRHLNSFTWNDAFIKSVADAVTSGRQIKIMGEFGNTTFKVVNGELYFTMPEFEKQWKIVNEKDKDDVLRALYQDPTTTANSRDGFYSHVSQRFVGITKSYVHTWLKNQESYQLHVKVPQPKNLNVIITKKPDQLWFVDVTYIKRFQQGHYKYILSVVDHFTKHAWTTPLTNTKAATIATAMSNIWSGKNDGQVARKPETIQTDNGLEFDGEFDKLLKELKIKHTRGYAYAPQSQGTVESFNKTIKRKLVGYMTAIDTEQWVQHLPKITENYNNTRHSMTKQTPNDLYWGKTEKQENEKIIRNLVKRRYDNNIKSHASASNSGPMLEVGDYVRLSKWSWNPDRDPKGEENFVKARKSGGIGTKKYYAGWTRAVFIVKRRLGKEADLKVGKFNTVKYILADPNKLDENGRPVTLEGRRFYRADLLKVDLEQTKDIAGQKLDIKKYTLEDMNKFVADEKEENKKSKSASVGETRPVDTSKPFWQHQHIVGMHVWNRGKYVGAILMISNKKNPKGKSTKSAVIQKENNTFTNYAINTLINRKSKGIVLTASQNLNDVYEGPVTLKLNG